MSETTMPSPARGQLGLPIRSLIGVVTLLLLGEYIPGFVLVQAWRARVPWTATSVESFYPASVLFVLALMIVTMSAHWPAVSALIHSGDSSPEHRQFGWDAFIGASAGLIASVLTGLFIFQVSASRLFVSTVLQSLLDLRIFFLVLLLVVLLPIATEVVFRGIILNTLLNKLRPIEAVLLSAVIFALLWPVFGFWAGFVIGLAASVVYHRTHSLVAAIFVNATATICIGVFLVLTASQHLSLHP